MRTMAALARTPGAPLEVGEITLDDPREDEVLVKVLAAGICHTDLSAAAGRLPVRMPIVLGHEGAGVVVQVGSRVSAVKPGDRVLLTPDFCGTCRQCRLGATTYCERTGQLVFGGTRLDGSTKASVDGEPVRAGFFGQSSFSEYTLATERNILPVAGTTAPLAHLAALTCGVSTGAGAVLNALQVRPEQSLAVFGTGTVGLAAVMAAKMVGVRRIVAVDRHPIRLELARELGATHVIDTGVHADAAAAVHDLFPSGVDRTFDSTGVPAVLGAALASLGTRGICGFVAGTGATLPVDLGSMLIKGAQLRGIMGGDATGLVFLADLVTAYEDGRLPVDRLVTTYRLDRINQAFEDMRAGRTIKPVIVFDDADR
ncbi:NAD(P)-dependent alcohol dehydrogenase [Microbacterium sp. 18062]|uniref:NAD(P)-dependent alcohol dehydrogenase n=1 Tax=Microbacterium sp. 18062 TaxID=2681410 RepID=UPI00135C4945|nr:NAD(P)-dependent alcohol dehydrogenase [Microbacterium sp. 18062]